MKKKIPAPRGFRPLTIKDKYQPGDVGRMSNGDLLPVTDRMHGDAVSEKEAGNGWFRPLIEAKPAAAEAAHTPGPWDLVPLQTGNFAIGAGNPSECIAKVLRLQADNAGRDEETVSNARLIAAAPELLRAMQDLADNVDKDLSGYWTESTSNFMQQARNALKATKT